MMNVECSNARRQVSRWLRQTGSEVVAEVKRCNTLSDQRPERFGYRRSRDVSRRNAVGFDRSRNNASSASIGSLAQAVDEFQLSRRKKISNCRSPPLADISSKITFLCRADWLVSAWRQIFRRYYSSYYEYTDILRTRSFATKAVCKILQMRRPS